jgi:hypothetical protein
MSKRMMVMVVAVAMGVLQPAFGPVVSAQAREGITVHGHWVIDVRNPDGTLASHSDFENALTPNGAAVLAMFLSREATAIVEWVIELVPNGSIGAPFGRTGGSNIPAHIYEAAAGPLAGAPNLFGTLTVARQNSTVVLKGTATAATAGEVVSVRTALTLDIHGSHTPYDFSGTVLANPVSLSAGQIIQVTVAISFSSSGV